MRQVIKGTCVDLSSEGKGVVKNNKDIIFVDGLFPNEEADIEILYHRAGVYYGKVIKLKFNKYANKKLPNHHIRKFHKPTKRSNITSQPLCRGISVQYHPLLYQFQQYSHSYWILFL